MSLAPALPPDAVYYDRIASPIASRVVAERRAAALAWADRNGYRVSTLCVDTGAAALYDGAVHGDWPVIAHGRPELARAIGLCAARPASLLIAAPDQLSEYNASLRILLDAFPGLRVLCADGSVIERSAATFAVLRRS